MQEIADSRTTQELHDQLQRVLTSLVVLRPILHEAVDGGIEAEAELGAQASWRPLTMTLTHLLDTAAPAVQRLRELEQEGVRDIPAGRTLELLNWGADEAAEQGAVPVIEQMAAGLRHPGLATIRRDEHLLSVRAYGLALVVAARNSDGEVIESIEPLRRTCEHVLVCWMSPESEHGLPHKGKLTYDADVVTLAFGERRFVFRAADFRAGLDHESDVDPGRASDA